MAIGMYSSMLILDYCWYGTIAHTALALITQDHKIKFKLFQNGGTFLLAGYILILSQVGLLGLGSEEKTTLGQG